VRSSGAHITIESRTTRNAYCGFLFLGSSRFAYPLDAKSALAKYFSAEMNVTAPDVAPTFPATDLQRMA
jgi:hypothetical protein